MVSQKVRPILGAGPPHLPHVMALIEFLRPDLESKKTTLIGIVQQLGEYINDEDPILRGKAVSFLTAVIKALSPKFLSRQQIQVLTSFFCDRIEDGGAVAGLDTLQRLDRFTKELAAEVAQAYVQSTTIQFTFILANYPKNQPTIHLRSANSSQYLFAFSGPPVSISITAVPGISIAQ